MLEIATSLLVYLATSHNSESQTSKPAPKVVAREVKLSNQKYQPQGTNPVSRSVAEATSSEVKSKVKTYFSDIPLLTTIAGCESHYNQFDKEGKIFRGVLNSADVGVMQINEFYHLEASKKLGLNIHTLEGNLAYARYLYEQEGSRPWSASEGCWKKQEYISNSSSKQLAMAKK